MSCLLLHSVVGNAQSLENESEIVAPGASLQQVAADYEFTEGPAADAQGNVFFTDQPNNRIMKWTTDGTLSVFMEDAGRANGLFFDRRGNLIACADEKNQLWQISPDEQVTVLVNDFQGKRLNGPNDLWVDLKGGIYFTDPYYPRDYWAHTKKDIENEQVYYLASGKETLTPVATDLVKPNGIVGTADGKQLYVADIGDKKTYVYQVNDDGSLSDKQLFADMGSDGLTLDSQGNVYLTGQGVTVFDKQGKQIKHIAVDEGWTANVCFGGKDRKTLFVTAMKSLYTLEMRVRGVQ
ncbi:MAG: SMP-30/gluconolactonase/LRE family protein [Tunicatimonas sp.]